MKNKLINNIKLSAILLSLLVITSCSKKDAYLADDLPKYGGTLRITASAELGNLDPQKIIYWSDWNVASMVYDGLVSFDENYIDLIPTIAKSWQKFDEGKRIVFNLRDDVFFHDDPCFVDGEGRNLTAEDVLFTFKRIADPDLKCANWYIFDGKIQGLSDYFNQTTDEISGIKILDDYTIEFNLTKPYFSFLKLMASPTAFIVPKEAVDYYGENIAKHPVGTGPFRLVQWKQLEQVSLIKNKKYWLKDKFDQQLPYLDGIEIILISNPVLTVSEFMKGSFDLFAASGQTYNQLLDDPNFKSKFKIAKTSQDFAIRFLGFSVDKNTSLSKFAPARQAIALGFDRESLKQDLNNIMNIANSFVPKSLLPNVGENWFPFDLDFAKTTIATVDPSIKKQEIVICSNIRTKAVETLSRTFENLDLNYNIDIHPVNYYEDIVEERPDIFRISFYPSYPDPEEYYALFYSKSSPTTNVTGYKNPTFDELLENAMVEQNQIKRQNYFYQLEKILKKDVPVLYISHSLPKYFITPHSVYGLMMKSTIPDFRHVWIKAENVPEN